MAGSFIAVAVMFVGVLFIPFRSITELIEDSFDDFTVDLDLKANEQDDMIAAALPQEEKVEEDANKLNKVDEATELPPEQLEQTVEAEDTDSLEQKEETPPINQNEDDPDVLKVVEQLPQYPGGMVEFMKWLTATLKYPEQALQRKIQGKVMISFIVGTDGTLSDIKVMKGAHKLLDDEAMRVANLMPKWEAGKNKGKPCKTMVAIPIVFEL